MKKVLLPPGLCSGFAKDKGTDQPVHPYSLISAFVIRYNPSSQACSMQKFNYLCKISIICAKFQLSMQNFNYLATL